jgi:hypothetical protein
MIQRWGFWKLNNCTKNCLICDQPLGFQGVKPTVCSRDLCTHGLYEYGLGTNIAGEVLHNLEVVGKQI